MILCRDSALHVGKTIKAILRENDDEDLVLCERVRIEFTDGSNLMLQPDCRGGGVYISEFTE